MALEPVKVTQLQSYTEGFRTTVEPQSLPRSKYTNIQNLFTDRESVSHIGSHNVSMNKTH